VVTPLQRHTGVPVYRQLQGLVRENIASGVWKVGQAIPSEQALVQQYGIARMTVRQALDGLIREGLLRRERGRGTFVAQQWVERELSRLRSFSEDMRARNMVPSPAWSHARSFRPAARQRVSQVGCPGGGNLSQAPPAGRRVAHGARMRLFRLRVCSNPSSKPISSTIRSTS